MVSIGSACSETAGCGQMEPTQPSLFGHRINPKRVKTVLTYITVRPLILRAQMLNLFSVTQVIYSCI